MTERVDAVVVGAGLAGLTAARELSRAGRGVVVLEARERVGGRALTRQVDGAAIDVGAQWIGPTQHRVRRLVSELGLTTFPTYATGEAVLDRAGRVTRYTGTIPRISPLQLVQLEAVRRAIDHLARSIDPSAPASSPDARRLDRTTLGSWLRRRVPSRDAREIVGAAVRVIFGAEPEELSALHVLAYARAGGSLLTLVEVEGGAQETRIAEGAGSIAPRLAEGLSVVTSAPVTAVRHDADAVEVEVVDGRAWRARDVVVALAPSLTRRIRFDPPLPAAADQLAQRMPMGATTKVVAVYERPFWREAGLSGELVATRGPVSVAFDASDADAAVPAVVAFVVGAAARGWSARPPRERREAVLAALARAFGAAARRPRALLEEDWAADPWSGGCPTANPLPGTLTSVGTALTAPVGRIHWAGTERSAVWRGYLEGAVASGERAAAEVAAEDDRTDRPSR